MSMQEKSSIGSFTTPWTVVSAWQTTSFFGAREKLCVNVAKEGSITINVISQSAFQRLRSALIEFFSRGKYRESYKAEIQKNTYQVSQGAKFLSTDFIQKAYDDIRAVVQQQKSSPNDIEIKITQLITWINSIDQEHPFWLPVQTTQSVAAGILNGQKKRVRWSDGIKTGTDDKANKSLLEVGLETPLNEINTLLNRISKVKESHTKWSLHFPGVNSQLAAMEQRIHNLNRKLPSWLFKSNEYTEMLAAQLKQEEQSLETIQVISDRVNRADSNFQHLEKILHDAAETMRRKNKFALAADLETVLDSQRHLRNAVSNEFNNTQDMLKFCDVVDTAASRMNAALRSAQCSDDIPAWTPLEQIKYLESRYQEKALTMKDYKTLCNICYGYMLKLHLNPHRYFLERNLRTVKNEKDHLVSDEQKEALQACRNEIQAMVDSMIIFTQKISTYKRDNASLTNVQLEQEQQEIERQISKNKVRVDELIKKIAEIREMTIPSMDRGYFAVLDEGFKLIKAKKGSNLEQQIKDLKVKRKAYSQTLIVTFRKALTKAEKEIILARMNLAKKVDQELFQALKNPNHFEMEYLDRRLWNSLDQLQAAYERLPNVDKSIQLDEIDWYETSKGILDRMANQPDLSNADRDSYASFEIAFEVTSLLYDTVLKNLNQKLEVLEKMRSEIGSKAGKYTVKVFDGVIGFKEFSSNRPTVLEIAHAYDSIWCRNWEEIDSVKAKIIPLKDGLGKFEEQIRILSISMEKEPSQKIKILIDNFEKIDPRKHLSIAAFRTNGQRQELELLWQSYTPVRWMKDEG